MARSMTKAKSVAMNIAENPEMKQNEKQRAIEKLFAKTRGQAKRGKLIVKQSGKTSNHATGARFKVHCSLCMHIYI